MLLVENLADHDRAVVARVERDLAARIRQRLAGDVHAGLLVLVLGADLLGSP
jgi:hypothetical protein